MSSPRTNHSIQRMRASRSGQSQFSRQRRLALTADAGRYAAARMKTLSVFVLILALSPAVLLAQGSVTVYTDRSAFNAAAESLQTITFTGYAGGGSQYYGRSLTISGVTFTSTLFSGSSDGNLYVANLAAYDSRPVLWNYDVMLPLLISLPPGTTAFGADFSATTDTAHQPLGDPFVATVGFPDGTSYSFDARKWPHQTFWGFTSAEPVTILSYSDGGAFFGLHFEVLDNVAFGTAVIPEPSSLTLVFLSFAGFALRQIATKDDKKKQKRKSDDAKAA